MDPTQAQTKALLMLGRKSAGYKAIPSEVLKELLEFDLVYWRKPDELDFTEAGRTLYLELTGTAAMR